MKKNLFLFFALLFTFTGNLYSQSGWFWQNPSPQGNNITSVKMFDENSGIFVNADNILRTENGGASWEVTYTGFPWLSKSFSAPAENVYYMLADTAALIRSTDKGRTWSYISNNPAISNSLISFNDVNTGFAVKHTTTANTFIYRTSDAGMHWDLCLSNETAVLSTVKFLNALTGIAAGKRQPQANTIIYRTTDAGLSWDTVANNCKLQNIDLYFTGGTGYLFGQESGMTGRTYKTTDGGMTWNIYTQMNTVILYEMQFVDDQRGFALASNRIYRTTNGGINWTNSPILVNNTAYTIYNMYFANSMTGYTAGGNGVILKTTDAGFTWSKIAGNSFGITLWDISFADNNTGFIISDYNKILGTTNGGNTWHVTQLANNLYPESISKVNSNIWYIATWQNGKVLKTTNCGLSWDTTYANVYSPTCLEFINESTGYGVCKYNNFFKTTNGGLNWLVTSPFGSQNWAMDIIDENTGFVGNDGGRIYKTTDGGTTWNIFNPKTNGYITDIKFINSSTGFISSSYGNYGISKTTNGGSTWTQSLPGIYISDLSLINDNTYIALSYNNIFKTTDSGETWMKSRTCSQEMLDRIWFSDSMTGWAIGYNGTIIKTTNGGESVTFDPPTEIPTSFYLFQNYPNPFNPVTTIRYGIPNDMNIKIKVYDILGRIVAQLVNENQSAGNYTLSFNGSQYASGVYFITLETPDFIQSRKMVLLK